MRFRSIPEFKPHAAWLMTDPTLDKKNCVCKYCGGNKSQSQLTAELGLRSLTNSGPSVPRAIRAPPPPRTTKTRPIPRQTKPYEVSTAPRPIRGRKPRTSGPQEPMSSDRYDDLQAMYSELEMPLRRWHREEELVWFRLRPAICGTDPSSHGIFFWPGLIEDVMPSPECMPLLGTDGAVAHPGIDVEMDDWTHDPDGTNIESPRISSLGGGQKTIRQSTKYTIKVLGTKHTRVLSDRDVLPWSVYFPPEDLLRAINQVSLEQLSRDLDAITSFEPSPSIPINTEKPETRFNAALIPYSFAMEIATNISKTWTPTDEWSHKLAVEPHRHTGNTPNPYPNIPPTVPNSPVPSKPGFMTPPMASLVAPAAVSALRATGAASAPPSEGGSFASLSIMPVPSTSQMLPTFLGPQKQIHYQGLWWGGERLWVDELVRLKPSRRQIAALTGSNILPPSGPSQSNPSNGDGAVDRGLFMLLQGLFVVEIPRGDGGMKKECRASGMLFELADQDYVEMHAFNNPSLSISQTPHFVNASKIPTPLSQSHPRTSTPGPSSQTPVPSTGPSPSAPSTAPPSTPPQRRDPSPDSSRYFWPLPPAPPGYKFRPVLNQGKEVVIPLTLISSRYYPNLFQHPLLNKAFEKSREVVRERNVVLRAWSEYNPVSANGLNIVPQRESVPELERLLCLEGLCPEFDVGVYPTRWKGGRGAALRDAETDARDLLVKAIQGANALAMEIS